MKIKTSELTGPALDWAVAKCEGYYAGPRMAGDPVDDTLLQHGQRSSLWLSEYGPDTYWSQGGPIIERERIMVAPAGFDDGYGNKWNATWIGGWPDPHENGNNQVGTTPLIAAMRCYVASRMGDEIDVPEELA